MTPVVLMSAKSDRIRDQFVQQTRAIDAITKPFDAQALVAGVENALRRFNSKRVSSARLPELDAEAVVDRPARARIDGRHALLALRHAAQVLRAHALEPGGPDEHGQEREGEDDEQQADAAVGHLRRHSPPDPTFK